MKRVFSMAIVVVLTLAILCLVACGEETHVHTYAEKVVKATCVNPGYTEYTPTCGCEGLSVYRDHLVAPSASHKFVELSREDSTCTKEGHIVSACETCGSTKIETIAIKAHAYGELTYDSENVCIDRLATQTCACGDVNTITVPATHKPATTVVDPTCEEEGSIYTFCVDCRASLGSEPIAALGHTWGEKIVDLEATCTEPGKYHYECETCGVFADGDEIIPEGHKFDVEVIDADASCYEDGLKHNECLCGEKELDEEGDVVYTVIPATGHIYEVWTESEEFEGYLHSECEECGYETHKKIED